MALRQPPQQQQRRQIQRPASIPQSLSAHDATGGGGRVDESQEWILFSPAYEDEHSLTSHTSQTPRTTNLGGFSELDSLETGIHSNHEQDNDNDDGDVTCQGTDMSDEDGEELDSLDDGLHAFHQPFSLDQSGGAVLPAHDGLGSFPALYHNDSVQEHLWQFERYNPNRRRPQRRRSSLQRRFDALDQQEVDKQEERRLRIEKWRLEQSHAVLEEIEKETRRRQRRLSIASRPASTAKTVSDSETESFWQRITRRVIKDLMGLDDTTLSVIFGEELAPGAQDTPTRQSPLTETLYTQQDRAWENRLLNRIARELNILAYQITEQDKTFSTYTPHQPKEEAPASSQPRHIPSTSPSIPRSTDTPSTASAALFAPTFANPPQSPTVEVDTSLWGIPEEARVTVEEPQTSTQDNNNNKDTDYWERDLDIGVVFRYLRSRFSSRPPSPSPPPQQSQPSVLPPDWAAPTASALGTSPESRRRADLIRRHHPLVSHAASVSAARRRESLLLRLPHALHRRAASSSCASQSTKRTRSGGSRRYWDFPSGAGSTAGGSLVSVGSSGAGVMGGWGEV